MKKVLATLLAVLLTFSAIAVYTAAEDDAAPAGNVYAWPTGENVLIPLNKSAGELTVLQAGDQIQFEKITATGATEATPKRVEIIYYPDAASLGSVSNKDWKENYIPKYDLNTKNWDVDTPADYYAKSPNYYKSFATSDPFVYGDEPLVTVIGMGAEAVSARDSERVERGVAPIDFALNNAKFQNGQFVGWVVKSVTWGKSSNSKSTIELYALWDRNPSTDPSETTTKPTTTKPAEGESKVYDNPIQEAMDKVLSFINKIREYIMPVVGGIGPAIGMLLNGAVRNWLYSLFDIEA